MSNHYIRNICFSFFMMASLAMHARGRILPFPADSALNTGIAVVVCPGGSYSWLDMDAEGVKVAEWLNANGINAYVLRYRVASVGAYITGFRVLGIGHKYPDMLIDVQDALRYVYEHAEADGVDTTMIGVMGFSAGGHLTMMSHLMNHTPYRPHFLCPIYPVVTMCDKHITHNRSRRGALGVWRQFNTAMQDSLSIERHIPADCPPVFLVNCADDPIVHYRNSFLLDSALSSQHISHQFIHYQTGGHGFGASDNEGTAESQQWKQAFITWISNINCP